MPAIEGGARIFPAPFPRDAPTVLSCRGSGDTIGSLKAYNAGVFLVRGAARAAHCTLVGPRERRTTVTRTLPAQYETRKKT